MRCSLSDILVHSLNILVYSRNILVYSLTCLYIPLTSLYIPVYSCLGQVRLLVMQVGQRRHTLNVGQTWTIPQRHPHPTGPSDGPVGTRHLPASDWEVLARLSWEPHPPQAHLRWQAPRTLLWQLQLGPWRCRCRHPHLVSDWKGICMGKDDRMGWGRDDDV